MEDERIKELYSQLTCALTHDLNVCNECKKCEGKNAAEIRMNLIKNLSNIFQLPLP